jgi:hypothetical protein
LVRKPERQSDCGEIQLPLQKESFGFLEPKRIENVLEGMARLGQAAVQRAFGI